MIRFNLAKTSAICALTNTLSNADPEGQAERVAQAVWHICQAKLIPIVFLTAEQAFLVKSRHIGKARNVK
jgi:hypothetical protein